MLTNSVKVWTVLGKHQVLYMKIFLGEAKRSPIFTVGQSQRCVNTLREQSQTNTSTVRMSDEIYRDCLILGAGISGIDAAYYIQQYCPWASFLVLERRSNLGGTWDFFKYPGIRSDSDMYTFG